MSNRYPLSPAIASLIDAVAAMQRGDTVTAKAKLDQAERALIRLTERNKAT
ncbi:hypothetical protein [Sphingomonas sp. NFX23]|uniref:hypothetical protein n=1 Tax=Sphingomonas sp. NFX23 TaxID=2819532 RepID=UPI003CEC5023